MPWLMVLGGWDCTMAGCLHFRFQQARALRAALATWEGAGGRFPGLEADAQLLSLLSRTRALPRFRLGQLLRSESTALTSPPNRGP